LALASALPDAPSAEPLVDLKAQLTDMHDPSTPRRAVYLSPANVHYHGVDGVKALAMGNAAISNFDGKGGVLIVPNAQRAKEAQNLRQSEPNLQKVLGQLTGAGQGKSPDHTIVVQGRTQSGAVATEGAERPDEVRQRVQAVRAQGKTPVVLTVDEAIERRMAGLK